MEKKKWRVLVLAGALVAPIAGLTFAYPYGASSLVTALFDRPVTDLTEEDYTAYSGFIEDYVAQQSVIPPQGEVALVNETLSFAKTSILPLEVVSLGSEEVGRDLFLQNEHAWQLQPSFHGSHKVTLIGKTAEGYLQVSRIGFNHGRTLGMLYYVHRCGVLCGQSGWVLLRKADNHWKIDRFGHRLVN
jgi:hypothetical protein